MYQFSLKYFVNFIIRKMNENQKLKDDVQARVIMLIRMMTLQIFKNITTGLYEKHKLLFAFLIAI